MHVIPNPSLIGDLSPALLEEESAARAALAAGRPRGAVTGFSKLDRELGGFLVPGIHTILAAPGAGKTSLTAQIGAQCGCPCLFVTVEMRPVEILRRCIARETETYLNRLRGGELSDEALRRLTARTFEAAPMFAIHDATQRKPINPEAAQADQILSTSITAIQNAAYALRERFEAERVLIVLDSLTDWVGANITIGETEYTATERALNDIKALAAAIVCPVLVIVHRNRTSNKDSSGENQMFGGKASGRIEYVSESLWTIENGKDKEPDVNGLLERKLTLNKNRYGVPGKTLTLLFEGRVQKFTEG